MSVLLKRTDGIEQHMTGGVARADTVWRSGGLTGRHFRALTAIYRMQSSFCMNGDSDGRKNMLELEDRRTILHRSVSARIGLEDLSV